jgi:hypothetical protein
MCMNFQCSNNSIKQHCKLQWIHSLKLNLRYVVCLLNLHVIFFLFCGSCSGIVVGSLYQPKNCTCKCLFLDVRVCLDVVNIQAKCTIFYACLTFFVLQIFLWWWWCWPLLMAQTLYIKCVFFVDVKNSDQMYQLFG